MRRVNTQRVPLVADSQGQRGQIDIRQGNIPTIQLSDDLIGLDTPAYVLPGEGDFAGPIAGPYRDNIPGVFPMSHQIAVIHGYPTDFPIRLDSFVQRQPEQQGQVVVHRVAVVQHFRAKAPASLYLNGFP